MASGAEYRVTSRAAARRAVGPDIRATAEHIASTARQLSPRGETGEFADGWEVVPGRDPGTSIVQNMVEHGKYVEYGTIDMPATPALGPAVAATGLPRWPG